MQYLIDENFNYKKYSGSSVLIVGGGPSTNEVKWENIKADFVWTCNDFYLNKKTLSTKFDLVALGNLVNFNNEALLEYLTINTECNILFELEYLYNQTLTENQSFLERFKGRYYFGRNDKEYASLVGPPARLMMLAANVGVSEIYYVGVDGFDPDMKNRHAFTKEPGLREGAVKNKYQMYYEGITGFLVRIAQDFKDITFYNLGEMSQSHNIPSFVSKNINPLPDHIKQLL